MLPVTAAVASSMIVLVLADATGRSLVPVMLMVSVEVLVKPFSSIMVYENISYTVAPCANAFVIGLALSIT